MLLVSYIQQYFNTSITVLTNQVWKLLIALFKVPNTGAFTVHKKTKTIIPFCNLQISIKTSLHIASDTIRIFVKFQISVGMKSEAKM